MRLPTGLSFQRGGGACSRTKVFHEPTPRTGRGPGTVRTDAGRARDRPRSMHEARIDNGRTALPPTRRRERGMRPQMRQRPSSGRGREEPAPTCLRLRAGTAHSEAGRMRGEYALGMDGPRCMRDVFACLMTRTEESTGGSAPTYAESRARSRPRPRLTESVRPPLQWTEGTAV